MAFNFDQFNNTLPVNTSSVRQSDYNAVNPSANSKLSKDEKEIFQKSKMNLNLPANILHLSVANDWLVVYMSNQLVFRLNIRQTDKQSEIFLDKYLTGLRVMKMFLDPTGSHLFFTLTPKSSGYSAELMYLNKNNNKPKIIAKVS
jgi:vacuolar protein sorting-associated protein 18